ncbi:unnamed protein product [Pseudo-nitzschia multistriata]|uniref:Uncharacterized protein n=1 Tax=Pseudo-nitzschia multistriata TaxID=183589 RepID=A0A448Z1Y1_9STRA|nr:unnamed protein product [Pseudo-nitzschia multistriata]
MCRFMVRTKVKKKGSRSNLIHKASKELKSKTRQGLEVNSSPSSVSASYDIFKSKSLPEVQSFKQRRFAPSRNDNNLAFPKSKSFSSHGQNNRPLERLLMNSPKKSPTRHNGSIMHDMNFPPTVMSMVPVRDIEFQNEIFHQARPVVDTPFSDMHFTPQSNIIYDSSQESCNIDGGTNSTSHIKLGMVPLQYEQNEIHGNSQLISLNQQQQQEKLNKFQHQQQNQLCQEYQRLNFLQQQQQQLQEEEYRLLQLQMQVQNFRSSQFDHSSDNRCVVSNVNADDISNSSNAVSNRSGNRNFWDSMDNVDLDPTPILPEALSRSSSSSICTNSTVVTNRDSDNYNNFHQIPTF